MTTNKTVKEQAEELLEWGCISTGNTLIEYKRVIRALCDVLMLAETDANKAWEKVRLIEADNVTVRKERDELKAKLTEAEKAAAILFRYVDRLNDPTDIDPLEEIVDELLADVVTYLEEQA